MKLKGRRIGCFSNDKQIFQVKDDSHRRGKAVIRGFAQVSAQDSLSEDISIGLQCVSGASD